MSNDVLRDFLIQVRDNPKEAFSKLGDPEFEIAVELAVSKGYVSGFQPRRVARGRLTVEIKNPELTPAGIAYLSGNSL